MPTNKISPSVWFHTQDGKIAEIIEYYKLIFGDNFVPGTIMPLGQTPSGTTELCVANIFGQKYSLMSTEKERMPFNDAISFMIDCDDQREIDMYWNYFTKEGKESQCGWCIDKYGLRWQILPKNLGELMSRPNAWQVMMKQSKIIIAEY